MNSKRVLWPDIAKGIGILIVVFYHAIIPKIRGDFGFYLVHSFLSTVQMPLFFFVSGWLFEMKAEKYEHNKLKSVGSKFVHLMIPYFSFSVIYYILFNIALRISFVAPMISMGNGGYEKSSLPEMIFQILTFEGSMAKSLWFIYALFITTSLNILVPKIMKHPITIILLFLLPCTMVFTSCPSIISYIFLYISYFSLARLIFSKTDIIFSMKKYVYVIITILYFSGATLYVLGQYNKLFTQNSLFWQIINVPIREIVAVLGILFLCTTAHYISKSKALNKTLSYFGKNSFIIYLIHAPILTQSVVAAMIKFLPSIPPLADCFAGLIIGVAVPLLVYELIFKRIPILNTILLGAPLKRKTKS